MKVNEIDFAKDNSERGIRGNWAESSTARGTIIRSLGLIEKKPDFLAMNSNTLARIAMSQEFIDFINRNPQDVDWMWMGDGAPPVQVLTKICGVRISVHSPGELQDGVITACVIGVDLPVLTFRNV